MKVRVSRTARTDLRYIVDVIAQVNPVASRRYAELLSQRILSLGQFPERRAKLPYHPMARWVSVRQYLIIYSVGPDLVQILRILHVARDIRTVLSKSRLRTGESS